MTFAYPGYEQYHHHEEHDLHGFDGGFGGEAGESDYGHHQIASQRIGHDAHEFHHEEDEHVDYYVSFPFHGNILFYLFIIHCQINFLLWKYFLTGELAWKVSLTF